MRNLAHLMAPLGERHMGEVSRFHEARVMCQLGGRSGAVSLLLLYVQLR